MKFLKENLIIPKFNSLSEAFDFFVENSNKVSTIDNTGNRTYAGAYRSPQDIYEFCSQYVTTSEEEVWRHILDECKNKRMAGHWCCTVKRWVFKPVYKTEYSVNPKGGYDYYKNLMLYRYSWSKTENPNYEGPFQESLAYIRHLTQDENYYLD